MTVRTMTAGAVSLALATAVTACGDDDERTAAQPPQQQRQTSPEPTATAERREGIPIRVRYGEVECAGRLAESETARALADQLPLTIAFSDHNDVEKTGPLPDSLPVAGDKADDPAAGDIGYYAPGNDLVFYYGDAPAFDGIVVLGTFDSGNAALEDQDGTVRMTVERD